MISKSRESQLIRACKRCDFKTVQKLIFTDKKHTLKQRLRPQHHEPNSHHRNQMVHSQIDVNCREPRFKMTPLMIASLRGSRDIVLALIQAGANPTLKDIKGNTAVQLACMKQRFHVIDALLQNKSNPNDVNISGWNCLISAVNYFHEDSAIMLLLLLQTGVKTDHKDNSGLTPIDHAVKKNKINALRVILNYNVKLAQQCTRALVNASIKGYFDIVLLLLDYGVNPNRIDIITGTGALHEALRYNDAKDEKNVQMERVKIVQFLAAYGADPELANIKRETPMQLALQKPANISYMYVEALREYYKIPHKKSKFVSLNHTEIAHSGKYPLLRPQVNWTRNNQKFCSSYTPKAQFDLVTNLIDGDPTTMWRATGPALNWVIFDFKADHVVNKLRIYSWDSREMPRELFLQVSNSLEGPWNCVQSFKCGMVGSSVRNNAGIPVDIAGFNACARYWRLVVTKNHGAKDTSFHGIEFFGYDNRISKLLNQLKLNEYEHAMIENDLNQIEALSNCTYDKFDELPIDNKYHKEQLWNYILEFQRKVQPLKKLDWFNEPIPIGLVGQSLPAFSVTSTAFLTDTLHFLSHGGAIMEGETYVDMEPGAGLNDPSMAIFRNISFANPGKFIIEIRSQRNGMINITSQPIQIFEIGDPDYARMLAQYPALEANKHRKLPRLDIGSDVDSDDDTLDQIYGFADFNENTSKMKINKWLSKSQDDEEEINSGIESAYYLTGSQSGKIAKRGTQIETQTDDICFDDNESVQQEYEVQSFTLEFNDDLASMASFRINNVDSKVRPINEARVYVDNPDIFVPPTARPLTQVITPRNSHNTRNEEPQKSTSLIANNTTTSKDNTPHESENQYEKPSKVYKPTQTTNIQHPIASNKQNNSIVYTKSPSSIKKPPAPKIDTTIINTSTSVPPPPPAPHAFKLATTPSYKAPASAAVEPPNKSLYSKLEPPIYTPIKRPSINLAKQPAPDYNITPPGETYDMPEPHQITPTPITKQASGSTKVPSAGGPPPPPPPPPPLPPLLLSNNQPQQGGMLKFQKTKTSNAASAGAPLGVALKPVPKAPVQQAAPMNDLQAELEKKLVKYKMKIDGEHYGALSSQKKNNKEPDYSTIHRFDPVLIQAGKEVSFQEDQVLNDLNSILDNKENDAADSEKDSNFDPRDTFTAKAKEALEKYKIAKTSSNSSENSSVNFKSIVKSDNKRHAPLPFKMNQS